MRIYILKGKGTLASAFNRADKLRLRLHSERLLTQPPEQFQSEIALEQITFETLHISKCSFKKYDFRLNPRHIVAPCIVQRQSIYTSSK
ncbi:MULTISPECIES: hypothetical protein [unclassified Desulfovibrio]|uniref:hypothetical protein n=1 Tax=unclassified Desulfovibrio TaxID=2593640 RepID=UPI002FD9559E